MRFDRRSFLRLGAAGLLGRTRASADGPFTTTPGEPVFLLEHSTVEDMWRVRRKVNPLVKSPRNPVLVRDREWEGGGPLVHGTVLRDPRDGLFKCWYQVFDNEAYREHRPWSYRICYAISRDGFAWEKPELGLVEWKGSTRNNFIRLGREFTGAIDVQLVPPETGVPHRFAALYLDQPGVCLSFSEDGVRWTEHARNPIEPSHSDDHNILLYDRHRKLWMIYHRPRFHAGDWKRRRALIESRDLQSWTDQEIVLFPDEGDPPEIMVMPVFQRGNLFFGLCDFYDRTRGANEVELIFSSGGRRWERVPPRELFLPRGPAGDFDAGSIFLASDPVIVGDEMRFYYGGFDMDHERFFPSTNTAIGVGTLPLDRLFGLVNTRPDAPGAILSRPMLFRGSRLEINADVRGQLAVAVLDWEGKPLPGYSFEDAAVIRGDSLRHAVSWKGRGLQQRSEPSRLEFRMEGEAALYAFTVS
jgi:hypothetical protein